MGAAWPPGRRRRALPPTAPNCKRAARTRRLSNRAPATQTPSLHSPPNASHCTPDRLAVTASIASSSLLLPFIRVPSVTQAHSFPAGAKRVVKAGIEAPPSSISRTRLVEPDAAPSRPDATRRQDRAGSARVPDARGIRSARPGPSDTRCRAESGKPPCPERTRTTHRQASNSGPDNWRYHEQNCRKPGSGLLFAHA